MERKKEEREIRERKERVKKAREEAEKKASSLSVLSGVNCFALYEYCVLRVQIYFIFLCNRSKKNKRNQDLEVSQEME